MKGKSLLYKVLAALVLAGLILSLLGVLNASAGGGKGQGGQGGGNSTPLPSKHTGQTDPCIAQGTCGQGDHGQGNPVVGSEHANCHAQQGEVDPLCPPTTVPPTVPPTIVPTPSPIPSIIPPSDLIHLGNVCGETDILVGTVKVGSNWHVFRFWLDSTTHQVLKMVDLTPDLVGVASAPAGFQCLIAYIMGGNVYVIGSMGGAPYQVTHLSYYHAVSLTWDVQKGDIVYGNDAGNLWEVTPDGSMTTFVDVGTSPVDLPNGTLSYQTGTLHFGPYDTHLKASPVAWAEHGEVVQTASGLELLDFLSGSLIPVDGTSFASYPLADHQISGVAVVSGTFTWFTPETTLVDATNPNWWDIRPVWDQNAFEHYLSTLK